MKRAMLERSLDGVDRAAGLRSLPVLAVVALVGVAGRIADSPWYRGVRVGRGGGEFRMLKFRTMVPGALRTGVNSTAAGDRRITRVGRSAAALQARRTAAIVNVLAGDMSLVGPRPQVAREARLYTAERTAHARRAAGNHRSGLDRVRR